MGPSDTSYCRNSGYLVGAKWRGLQSFLERHKRGGSVRFQYVLTHRMLVFFHQKGTKSESRWSCDVLPDGMAAYFTGPRLEHFEEVDGIEPEEAYRASLALYRARLEWAGKVKGEVRRRAARGGGYK